MAERNGSTSKHRQRRVVGQRECVQCGGTFDAVPNQIICSEECRTARQVAAYRAYRTKTSSKAAEVDLLVRTDVKVLDHLPDRWHENAACRYSDEDFFTTTRSKVVKALKVCQRCEVANECYTVAMLDPHAGVGVWGGTTRENRIQALRRSGAEQPDGEPPSEHPEHPRDVSTEPSIPKSRSN